MKNTLVFIMLLIVVFACNGPVDTNNLIQRTITENWQYKQVNGDLSGNATVPGTIHTDLLNEGKIGDPFYRTNERGLQWIDKEDWEFGTIFDITEEEYGKEHLALDFKGLDTYADVYFNDSLLLIADNMFREWEVDIKPFARVGENALRIYFHSPINMGLKLLEEDGINYPAANDQSENGGIGDKKVSVFTRKAGYHYGWDWGPRFVTSGIWRPIMLKAWDIAQIKNTYFQQPVVNEKRADLVTLVSIESTKETSATVLIRNVETGKKLTEISTKLNIGTNEVSLPFSIINPKLWWSNGLGDPSLYQFATILIIDNKIISSVTTTTGIRDIKLIREKDQEGESFLFQLNGVNVFAKGANYIPNDNFLTRVDHDKYDKVIADAVNANMNMLRVWGGGIYENDYFYELCDKNGIMVWQDFMFACSMYPGQPEFHENIKQEAIDNVVRLRNHPSIVLWCGNNEINTAWSYGSIGGWGWKERFTKDEQESMQKNYMAIFHDILPDVVTKYTDNDEYWPSSPQSGYEMEQHAGYDNTSGDMHYWGVWHGLHRFEEFDKYRARFMSEFGFQAFPDFETVKSYTIPEDYDIESKVMSAHQRSGIGNIRIREYMSWYFNLPENFEDMLYMSNVLQAYGMGMGMEAHRRALPYCMGSLYWQINDCWPVASWSSTDYYHKWKAMHYAAKRAFEETILSPILENGILNVYGITDKLEDIQGKLVLKLIKFDGSIVYEKSISSTILGNTSTKIFESDNAFSEIDSSEVALNMQFVSNGEMVTEKTFYFMLPKDLHLPTPEIKFDFVEKEGKRYLEIESDKLARYVYINLPGQNEFFEDNYFELLPNRKRTILVTGIEELNFSDVEIKYLLSN